MKKLPILRLAHNREIPVLRNHPWIYSQAIQKIEGEPKPGDIVEVQSSGGHFLARGYYNPHSQIVVRILTRDEREAIDRAWLTRRIDDAIHARDAYFDSRDTNAYRLVHGESDFVPGLIVDRYDTYLVIQIHTLGIERMRDEIIEVLVDLLHPAGIYERSDVGVRKHEGLTDAPATLRYGMVPDEITIRENGATFLVNVREGQKTGFFLDQRENRKAIAQYAKDALVLNLFAYTGGFSVMAALAGATSTLSIDIAEETLAMAKKNFKANNLDLTHHEFRAEDAFEALRQFVRAKRSFDMIILDPPAFAKSRSAVAKALSAYTQINRMALSLLRTHGILVSTSCSAHITPDDFLGILMQASVKAGRRIQVIRTNYQPPDHPVNPSFPEGRYLKCYYVRVVG
ncbi:MAG: class I SAM-dependent rRNA methyltransferase [Parcubacteria group bacterium]|nr:class I SAM-dependent rRNA methyltransferase [Parcubacteria group bacterium]